MNQPVRFPVPRSIVASMIVLILAMYLTVLSFFASQRFEQVNVGNLCGVNQNKPCLVSAPKAGWPLPFLVDHPGTSALGVLGLEDFRIGVFLLDLVFFVLLLSGSGWLLNRMGWVKPI